MPEWVWIVIAVAVVIIVIVALIAARSVSGRKRTERLKTHFGPEYDRAVGVTGDPAAAEKELVERERNRKKLDIVVLAPESRARYADQWRRTQSAFVDNPSGAVGDADRLVTELMRERGYPVDDFEQRAADISVDHPHVVEHYRAAHILHLAQEQGDIGTEAQREAFVHYRALFEQLLGNGRQTDNDTTKEARA